MTHRYVQQLIIFGNTFALGLLQFTCTKERARPSRPDLCGHSPGPECAAHQQVRERADPGHAERGGWWVWGCHVLSTWLTTLFYRICAGGPLGGSRQSTPNGYGSREISSPSQNDSDYKYGRFDASALHIAHALKQTEIQKAYNKAREKPIDFYLVSNILLFLNYCTIIIRSDPSISRDAEPQWPQIKSTFSAEHLMKF